MVDDVPLSRSFAHPSGSRTITLMRFLALVKSRILSTSYRSSMKRGFALDLRRRRSSSSSSTTNHNRRTSESGRKRAHRNSTGLRTYRNIRERPRENTDRTPDSGQEKGHKNSKGLGTGTTAERRGQKGIQNQQGTRK